MSPSSSSPAMMTPRTANSDPSVWCPCYDHSENDVVPSVWLGHRVDRMFQSSKVHGLVPTASVVALFEKAWLSR